MNQNEILLNSSNLGGPHKQEYVVRESANQYSFTLLFLKNFDSELRQAVHKQCAKKPSPTCNIL